MYDANTWANIIFGKKYNELNTDDQQTIIDTMDEESE